METGALGTIYKKGEIIFHQNDPGDNMYVVQDGLVEIFLEKDGQEIPLGVCRTDEFLGEMALFDGGMRSATARAGGDVRLLTIDKRNFMRRVQQDPTIAFRLVQLLTRRVRELDSDVAALSLALKKCMIDNASRVNEASAIDT